MAQCTYQSVLVVCVPVFWRCALTASCCLVRNDDDTTSWWMTGRTECLYFLVLFKSSVNGQVRLQKMAGDLQECVVFGVVMLLGLGWWQAYRSSCAGSQVLPQLHTATTTSILSRALLWPSETASLEFWLGWHDKPVLTHICASVY